MSQSPLDRLEADRRRYVYAHGRYLRHEYGDELVDELFGRGIDVLGLLRGKPREEARAVVLGRTRRRLELLARGTRRDVIPDDFSVPAAIGNRPATADGRTSFHFAHDHVSKSRAVEAKESGRVPRPGAGRRHQRYIERLEALAVIPELEQQIDQSPEGHQTYIERSGAVADLEPGSPILFTNIHHDPKVRAQVWALIEKHERDPEADAITLNLDAHADFWRRAADDDRCPQDLRVGIEGALSGGPARFTVASNEKCRAHLSSLGWKPSKETKTDEVASFHDGRGGRIQYRIVGELPDELPMLGRAQVLKEFSYEFEKRNLPYVTVVHAPGPKNKKKNWHFHLIYYDRPIALLEDGRWDFAAQEVYIRSRPGRKDSEKRTRFPHRQNKLKVVTRKEWIYSLRCRLAEITNSHLEKAQVERRVDPGSYKEMGIDREGQRHLGTKAANLETMGIATATGYENANKEFDGRLNELESRRVAREIPIDHRTRKWTQAIAARGSAVAREKLERWNQLEKAALEYEQMKDALALNAERQMSRGQHVLDRTVGELDDLKAKPKTERREARIASIERRRAAAEIHLDALRQHFAGETRLQVEFEEQAQHCRAAAVLEWQALQTEMNGRVTAPVVTPAAPEVQSDLNKSVNKAPVTTGSPNGVTPPHRFELEEWLRRCRRRRLIERNNRVEPVRIDAGDAAALAALGTSNRASELRAILATQDKMIAEIVDHLDRHPEALKGGIIALPKPEWDAAYSHFVRDDPDLKRAVENASVANSQAVSGASVAVGDEIPRSVSQRKVSSAASERPPRPSHLMAASIGPTATAPPERRQSSGAETPRRMPLNQWLEWLSTSARRLARQQDVILAPNILLERLDAGASEIMKPNVQRRLAGIYRRQERELKRLLAFAESAPEGFVEIDGRLQIRTEVNAELREIGRRWCDDPVVQADLRAVGAGGMRTGAATPPEPYIDRAPRAAENARVVVVPKARPLLSNPGEWGEPRPTPAPTPMRASSVTVREQINSASKTAKDAANSPAQPPSPQPVRHHPPRFPGLDQEVERR